MIQTEAERQFYLAAAGVRMWYARDPLPGAAPSADFDFAELDAMPSPLPESMSSPAQPTAKAERSKDHIANLQSLMEARAPAPEVSKGPTKDILADVGSSQQKVPAPPPADELSRNIPRVTLQTWVGQKAMLIAALSDESSLGLQQTLAGNILKALGEENPATLDIVRWPLFNNAGISLNNTAHLVDVVSAQLKDHEDKVVVMLDEGNDWLNAALGRQPEVRFSGSLANLAGNPTLKRELWQLLKPFRPD